MRLNGKRILLGVTGSIAAYKTAEIIRLLVKEGADIQVVMTESAMEFITPLTLSTLSGKPVLSRFSDPLSGSWNNHVELGLWADVFLIAPVTANTLAKFANGYADDLLSATYLSARCPVLFAPAMDLDMYAHEGTRQNISKLVSFGNMMIGPGTGALASGLTGEGRMAEPDEITDTIIKVLSPDPSFAGKKVLVSAGPTREAIDAVRFLSNHSSGKMGTAIAQELALRGANVTLVHGPGVKLPNHRNIKTVASVSASDMYNNCMQFYRESEIVIMAAAVADFTVAEIEDGKIKKKGGMTLELVPTKDILAEMGQMKSPGQFLVGFALEAVNDTKFATEKLEKKNLDMIIFNTLSDEGAGFNTDTNKVTIIDKNKNIYPYPLKTKRAVASDIAVKIGEMISTK